MLSIQGLDTSYCRIPMLRGVDLDVPKGKVCCTLGAFLLTVVTEKLRDFADYVQLMYAWLLVVILILRTAGFMPKRVRNYCLLFKRRPRQESRQ
jgi:hypothetical protein